MISLPLHPLLTPPLAVAPGNSWLLFYPSFLPFDTPSPLFNALSFSLSLGHVDLQIVMIAVRSSAMACRKSELVHVSEHRYALWTPAAGFRQQSFL